MLAHLKTRISFHTQGWSISSLCLYNLCPDEWDEDKSGKKDKFVFWLPLDLDQKLATSGNKTNRAREAESCFGQMKEKHEKNAQKCKKEKHEKLQ